MSGVFVKGRNLGRGSLRFAPREARSDATRRMMWSLSHNWATIQQRLPEPRQEIRRVFQHAARYLDQNVRMVLHHEPICCYHPLTPGSGAAVYQSLPQQLFISIQKLVVHDRIEDCHTSSCPHLSVSRATVRNTWLDMQRNCKKIMTLRRGIEPRSPALDIDDDKRKSWPLDWLVVRMWFRHWSVKCKLTHRRWLLTQQMVVAW